ncbi:MAG: hypothetical protein JXA15_04005 [Spirochaetales bacterium]|nr:hypothetical protein [Spirochaetales bacterium]
MMVPKPGLDAKAAARIGKLGKTILANRGLLKAGPLIATTLVAGGVAVYGAFFLNSSLERLIELALESIFEARADVIGLRFDPIGMDFSMSGLTIADRDAPMTNLVETGRVALNLNPEALLLGRVHIEEASVSTIELGTTRSFPGSLPGKTPKLPEVEQESPVGPPLVDLAAFDAKALLERELDKLSAPEAWTDAGEAYDTAKSEWTARADTSRLAVVRMKESTRAALAIEPAKIANAADAAAAIAKVKEAIDATKAASAEAVAVAAGVAADIETARSLERMAREALSTDLAYLLSLVDFKSGAAAGVLEPVLREVLSSKAETALYYGRRAYEAAIKIRELALKSRPDSAGESAAMDRDVSKGRDIQFKSSWPVFRLDRLGASFRSGDDEWSTILEFVSTDPDLVPGATALSLGWKRKPSAIEAKGVADLRSSSSDAFAVRFSASAVPFDLTEQLAAAGLDRLIGIADISGSVTGPKVGGFVATATARASSLDVLASNGTIGSVVAGALDRAGVVNAEFEWTSVPSGKDSFKASTNLDGLIAAALSEIADKYAAKARMEIEQAVSEWATDSLTPLLGSKSSVESLLGAARGDEKAVGELRVALDRKLADLEARAKTLATGLLPGLPTLPTLPSLKP